MTTRIIGKGNIEVGQWDEVILPRRLRKPNQAPVILCHGSHVGQATLEFDAIGWHTLSKLIMILAEEGIPLVQGHLGGNTFANDLVSGVGGRIDSAHTYIKAKSGTTATKAHVIGASMGAGNALRWASIQPAKAASVVGFIPMVTAEQIYKENSVGTSAAGFTSAIASAWGLGFRTAANSSITNLSPILTNATANFTSDDIGSQIITDSGITVIPEDTKIVSVQSSTQVTMDKNAIGTFSNVTIGIAEPLPMSGTSGLDLMGVHLPRLLTNGIPSWWFGATDDPLVPFSAIENAAAASAGRAISLGTGGHAAAAVAKGETIDGKTDWESLVNFILKNS